MLKQALDWVDEPRAHLIGEPAGHATTAIGRAGDAAWSARVERTHHAHPLDGGLAILDDLAQALDRRVVAANVVFADRVLDRQAQDLHPVSVRQPLALCVP